MSKNKIHIEKILIESPISKPIQKIEILYQAINNSGPITISVKTTIVVCYYICLPDYQYHIMNQISLNTLLVSLLLLLMFIIVLSANNYVSALLYIWNLQVYTSVTIVGRNRMHSNIV